MPQAIRDVMTSNPVCLPHTATLREAAQTMRDRSIGDVIVVEGSRLCGLVTDRDIVVRAVAEGRDPSGAKLADVCTHNAVCLKPTDSVDEAIKLMRDQAIRRVPVVDNDKPVGIVSLGDLAMERDPESALADISAAPPNA